MPITNETRLLTLYELLERFPQVERYPCIKCQGLGQFVHAGFDIEAPYEVCETCQGIGDLFLLKREVKND